MTKTFAKIAARRNVKSAEPAMMPLGAMADGFLVWIFEFRSLGFVWDLVFGAWNFMAFIRGKANLISPDQKSRFLGLVALEAFSGVISTFCCRC